MLHDGCRCMQQPKNCNDMYMIDLSFFELVQTRITDQVAALSS